MTNLVVLDLERLEKEVKNRTASFALISGNWELISDEEVLSLVKELSVPFPEKMVKPIQAHCNACYIGGQVALLEKLVSEVKKR